MNRDAPQDDRLIAALCHASVLASFFGLFVPLSVWLSQRERSSLLRFQALQALVFQSIMLLLLSIGGILTLVLAGFLIVPVVAVIHLVLTTIATINSSKGERYCYPLLEGLGTDETS